MAKYFGNQFPSLFPSLVSQHYHLHTTPSPPSTSRYTTFALSFSVFLPSSTLSHPLILIVSNPQHHQHTILLINLHLDSTIHDDGGLSAYPIFHDGKHQPACRRPLPIPSLERNNPPSHFPPPILPRHPTHHHQNHHQPHRHQ